MRVLITGPSNFIAGHLSRELQDAGHLVSELPTMGDPAEAIKDSNVEVVIHLDDGSPGESCVYETVAVTAGVTAEVAKSCGELGVRLIYASTDEIYGDNGDAVSSEEEGPFSLPQTTYALGKLMGESLGLLYAPTGLTVLRISSPYGPGLEPEESTVGNLLWLARHGEAMPVYRAERSWCWIGDTVRAIRLTMEKGEGVYNIGRNDGAITMQEVAEMVCAMTGSDKDLIEVIPTPERYTPVRRISTQKLQRLGWEPRVSLYEGMRMTLESILVDVK